jgi:hypothetical protein
MKAFPSSVRVQRSCSRAFQNASAWDELVNPILQTDVCFLLQVAIHNHTNEEVLRKNAAFALKRLSPAYYDALLK